jgi:hypothetical protein
MRRMIGGGLGLAVGGFLASVAFAGTGSVPPLPTVSTPTLPTVSTPTLPTITSPPPVKLPPPPPQTTVSVPTQVSTTVGNVVSGASRAPAPVTSVTATSSGSRAWGGSSGSSSSGSVPSATSGSTTQFGGLIQVGRGTRQGSAVIRFVAPSAARAFVSVKQLFPSCAPVGHFSVRAHAGVNTIRFTGRVHGRKLQPGTYRFTVRARSGRLLRRVILVVAKGPKPTGRALAALRSANVCGTGTDSSSSTSGTGVTTPTSETPRPTEAGVVPAHGPNLHSGVLASAAAKTVRVLEPLLIALLAASVLLFGVASLPREAVPGPRLHDALAGHRLELAGLGVATLVGALLAFLLT